MARWGSMVVKLAVFQHDVRGMGLGWISFLRKVAWSRVSSSPFMGGGRGGVSEVVSRTDFGAGIGQAVQSGAFTT
jgi:hypothetical protein